MIFTLESPAEGKQAKQEVILRGWLVVERAAEPHVALRLMRPDGSQLAVKYGISRPDVKKALEGGTELKNSKVGFELKFMMLTDGIYRLEAKINQSRWKLVKELSLIYDPEVSFQEVYNPDLAKNFARHQKLIESKRQYYFEDNNSKPFNLDKEDPKLIAFYLPQYHAIKENDQWWGKGFTEWANVASAAPRFAGHEQPKFPKDFGYYDLKNNQVLRRQMALAAQHGIYGFCFYYYWFSGKKLLEYPLNTLVEDKDNNFKFMICWANENWTRRWDGLNQHVLIEQEHKPDDPLKFIQDVEKILLDPRYIRFDGKPALLVYRPGDLKDPKVYTSIWRRYFTENHKMELHLIAVESFDSLNVKDIGFDRALEFTPLNLSRLPGLKTIPTYPFEDELLDKQFRGYVLDYRAVVDRINNIKFRVNNNYQSIMPAWDNDARRKGSGSTVFQGANPDIYGRWLTNALSNIKPSEPVFINAWNEWGEGAYLEPDKMYGHAYLNRTSEVLAKFSKNKNNITIFPYYNLRRKGEVKLAVILHLYYTESWETIKRRLAKISTNSYELFITIPVKSDGFIEKLKEFRQDCHVFIVPNQGRDVLPFVHLARRLHEAGYEYVLKIHSKRSMHRTDGAKWFNSLLEDLIPSKVDEYIKLCEILDQEGTGIVGPKNHFVSLEYMMGSNEIKLRAALHKIMGARVASNVILKADKYAFFAGTMFWARLDSIAPILNAYLQPSDFEVENGQLDGTFAHALERLLTIIPTVLNKKIYTISCGKEVKLAVSGSYLRIYPFAFPEAPSNSSEILVSKRDSYAKLIRVALHLQGLPRYARQHGNKVALQTVRSILDDRLKVRIPGLILTRRVPSIKFISRKLDGSQRAEALIEIALRCNIGKTMVQFQTFGPCPEKSIEVLGGAHIGLKIHLDPHIGIDFMEGDFVYLDISNPADRLVNSIYRATFKNRKIQFVWVIPADEYPLLAKKIVNTNFKEAILEGRILFYFINKKGKVIDSQGNMVVLQQLAEKSFVPL